MENVKKILLAEVKVPKKFALPNEHKMCRCRKYFSKHGSVDQNIVINKDGVLIDGYVRYLVLKENNVKEVEAIIRENEYDTHLQHSDYRNTPTKYVFARHMPRFKEYCWRVTDKTINLENLKEGSRIIVWTKEGRKIVKVTRIEILDKPPVNMSVKKVIKCLEN